MKTQSLKVLPLLLFVRFMFKELFGYFALIALLLLMVFATGCSRAAAARFSKGFSEGYNHSLNQSRSNPTYQPPKPTDYTPLQCTSFDGGQNYTCQ